MPVKYKPLGKKIKIQVATPPLRLTPKKTLAEAKSKEKARVNKEKEKDTLNRLYLALDELGIEMPFVREHKFAEGRKYAFDAAWPGVKLAIELEGGLVGGHGRHSRIAYNKDGTPNINAGVLGDFQKYNLASELGWTVIRHGYPTILLPESVAQIARVYHRLSGEGI